MLIAVGECRDRALEDPSKFVGLAGIELPEGAEVHALDDGRDLEEYVKISDPCSNIPSASCSVKPTTQSVSKTVVAKVADRSKAPANIKFGPPKGPKQKERLTTNGISKAIAQASTSSPETPTPIANLAGAIVIEPCQSRGPSPSISRPPTPSQPVDMHADSDIPATSTAAASAHLGPAVPTCAASVLSFSSAPAVTAPCIVIPRRAASAEPIPAPSCPTSTHRATSAQPTPSNWTGVLFAPPTYNSAPNNGQAAADVNMDAVDEPPRTALQYAAGSVVCTAATSTAVDGPTAIPQRTAPIEDVERQPVLTNNTNSAPPPGSVTVPSTEALNSIHRQKNSRKRKGSAIGGNGQKMRKTSKGKAKRTSSANASSAASGPDWLQNAQTLFKSENLGSEWDLLFSNWLKFEENSQLQGTGKLGCQRQPWVITGWIQRARASTYHPDIEDINGFKADFHVWWQSLQPDWRRVDSTKNSKQPEGDWGCIRQSGPNGLLSVVAALFFWGDAVQNTSARTAWLEALTDVSYVLEQLL